MERKRTRVVAAVVGKDGRYLCMQRARSGKYPYISEKWEFPGGKVAPGETEHEALLREIREEMDCDVYVGRLLARVDYDYPDFGVSIAAYLCKGCDDFKLLEHLDFRWLEPGEMEALDWAAADLPIVRAIENI